MRHLILFGDSVFDNAAYVGGGPDVVQQTKSALPAGWRATLKAVDGAVIADVENQLESTPADASHLVVSVGGNDALRDSGVLEESARSVADALQKLSAVRDRFRQHYAAMLDQVVSRGLPAAVCTIYEPRFPDRQQRGIAATALTLINDCITREAFRRGLSLVDLRLICSEDADFANPIEPSVQGGAKIARALGRFATGVGDARVISG